MNDGRLFKAEFGGICWAHFAVMIKTDVHRGVLLQAEINQYLDMDILFVKVTFEM